jgi:hypothetical protein
MGVRSHPTRIYVPVVPAGISISSLGSPAEPLGETEEEDPGKVLLLGISMWKKIP